MIFNQTTGSSGGGGVTTFSIANPLGLPITVPPAADAGETVTVVNENRRSSITILLVQSYAGWTKTLTIEPRGSATFTMPAADITIGPAS